MKYTKLCVLLVLGMAFLVDASSKLRANHEDKTELNAFLTCELSFNEPQLWGKCRKMDGTWQSTSINLNSCLGRTAQGEYICGQDLLYYSSNAMLSGNVLRLGIGRTDGSWNTNQKIDLNNYLENKDGQLLCDCINK